MAEIQGQQSRISDEQINPERVVARVARLTQALSRAEGKKAEGLQQSLDHYQAQLQRLKDALGNG